MSDHCIVCADSLKFCAYGRCGHKETCSKCVSRLRSVLKDPRCAYCQQQLACVYVTRFAGDYTQQVAPDDFDKLQERADAGDLLYLPSAQAYFDDAPHFQEISSLCSFTHPMAATAGGASPRATRRPFASLRALRSHLAQAQKLHFCDICLEGRKVFVSEQQVYTRQALERHLRQGDEEGAMAESGFSGHPECHFCRKRFYGENELYQHMHAAHEQCFLCRRAAPHKHVYYRDYPDLERHFKAAHFPCDHPACLENKFVVFPTEQELRTHTAREHGQALSRSERKQALTIPVAFTYRRGEQDGGGASTSAAAGLAAVAAGGQGAVVIGGAASVPARFSQQQRRGSRNNLSEQAQQRAAARASVETAQAEEAQRVAAEGGAAAGGSGGRDQTVQPGQQQASGPGLLRELEFPSVSAANGAAPAVGGRWVGGPAAGGSGLRTEDFPALPGTSKAAKKRAAKKKTAAEILAPGQFRVVNRGGDGPTPGLAADNFPALGAAPPQAALVPLRRDEEEWQQASRGGPRRPPSSQEVRPPAQPVDELPRNRGGRRPASGAGGAPPPPRLEFGAVPAPAAAPAPVPAAAAATAAAAPAATGGVSEALRAANRALVDKIKGQLGDGAEFGEFRQRSAAWVRGELSSRDYHAAVAALGLVAVVPELAATCPDAGKRMELLDAHASAFSASASTSGRGARGGKKKGGSWMPPEAAAAAASHAAQNSSWSCPACTLANAPAARACEACGTAKPLDGDDANRWRQGASAPAAAPATPAEVFPALPSAPRAAAAGGGASTSAAGSEGGGGKKGKQQKQSLNTFMQSTAKAHPQNVWRNAGLRGEWASGGAGSLAQQERALNDGWGKKK